MSEQDDEVMALLRDAANQWEAEALQRLEFHERVNDIPGPVGALLRQIADAHNGYEEARTVLGTTEGEAARFFPVLDEAVAVAAWLRDGGQLP